MKTIFVLGFFALLAIVTADDKITLENCKCWQGYEAKKQSDNSIKCVGILVLTIRECNEPELPHCKCSGDVTGILTDSTGTWCTTYSKGKEQKRWACENKEEWESYKKATAS